MENKQDAQSVSIKMPQSPHKNKKVSFNDEVEVANDDKSAKTEENKVHSHNKSTNQAAPEPHVLPVTTPNPGNNKANDKAFKTFESQPDSTLSLFCGNIGSKPRNERTKVASHVSASRYFDALQGPELDTLKPSEQIMLPDDEKWPFLLRFPVTTFGICLGVSSQAILWKALASNVSTEFLNISNAFNLVLWYLSIFIYIVIASTYLLKMIIYFKAVQREYYHPIRINFFFAPWITLLFLAIGVPPSITTKLPQFSWYVLMAPIFFMELKIYGEWMSGGQRRLSKVANPSNHLSVVGNFVGSLLGASMGLREGPLFFFAVGLAHYTVLFVTLYQRLPTTQTLPKELHPVFFLFVAAPSVGSMAWEQLNGSFDSCSRIIYFIALFLYFSLAVRVNFFRGAKFNLTWWAYTFPMTGAAIATIKYADEVSTIVTRVLLVSLSGVATTIVSFLFIATILHAAVYQDLFPNDIGIAISCTKAKTEWKWPLRGNTENTSTPEEKDVEDSEASQESDASASKDVKNHS